MKKLAVGILAHVDAGKTTLSEALLYHCGQIRHMGRVDHKDTFLDNYDLERERGITIFSKQALLKTDRTVITLLDTPGHVDFSSEMERTLQVMDYAVLLISAPDGIPGHTVTLYRLLERYRIPVFIFVNKMDQPGTDPDSLMAELTDRFGRECVYFSAASEFLALQPQDAPSCYCPIESGKHSILSPKIKTSTQMVTPMAATQIRCLP